MHREILGLRYGDGKQVDHIDGNGLNNQKSNVRICTRSQNAFNRKLVSSNSGRKGVTWHKTVGMWEAQIRKDGKNIYLGCFQDKENAATAYDIAAEKMFGEFALLNSSIV